MDLTQAPSSAAAPPKARRETGRAKPLLRGWQHLLWFEASLVAGTLLVVRAHGDARTVAAAVYAVSVSALFGTSALYHRGNWSPAWRRRLQRADHAMIFLLIAGTATPAFLLAMPGTLGLASLAALWALTLMAAATRMAWMMDVPELVAGSAFVGLGSLAGLAVPGVWIHAGVAPAALMLAGGLLYMVGALSFRRRLDPSPAVFGYHEVFHAFVCAAATCQFVAIAVLVR